MLSDRGDVVKTVDSAIANPDNRKTRRQALVGLFFLPFPGWAAAGQPRLGDDEWYRRFRVFVKFFNAFVDSLNDGKLDLPAWRQMREAWKNMDCN